MQRKEDGRRHCGASGHMGKECLAKDSQPATHPTATTTEKVAALTKERVPVRDPNGTWKEVGKKRQK